MTSIIAAISCVLLFASSASVVIAGILPVAAHSAAVIAPYATSYNAHHINHAIARQIIPSTPIVARTVIPAATAPAVVPTLRAASFSSSPYAVSSFLPASSYVASPYAAAAVSPYATAAATPYVSPYGVSPFAASPYGAVSPYGAYSPYAW